MGQTFIQYLKENNDAGLSKDDIMKVWKKVFPESAISVSGGALGGGGLYCKGFLAKDKSELSNGYWENDMLSYSFNINDGDYKETSCSILTNPPAGSYLAYGREKLRAKSIKKVSVASLEKRFKEVKQMVSANKDVLPKSLTQYLKIDEKV